MKQAQPLYAYFNEIDAAILTHRGPAIPISQDFAYKEF